MSKINKNVVPIWIIIYILLSHINRSSRAVLDVDTNQIGNQYFGLMRHVYSENGLIVESIMDWSTWLDCSMMVAMDSHRRLMASSFKSTCPVVIKRVKKVVSWNCSKYRHYSNICCLSMLTALKVWPSVEGHLKGVLYWGSRNLVNFPSLAPPLRLCVCTYLVLPAWRFGLCVQILYLFCLGPPTPLPICYSLI